MTFGSDFATPTTTVQKPILTEKNLRKNIKDLARDESEIQGLV